MCIFIELIGAMEFPSNPDPYLQVTGNGGCYNDTDLPTKPVTSIVAIGYNAIHFSYIMYS